MREEQNWYGSGKYAPSDAHPAEIDLILLAILRTAAAMQGNNLLARRLADRKPPMLDEVARLQRNQILVDEATDFSPVQLACMRCLAAPRTNSFFVSGDFNQRLTRWGSRSEDELLWVSPGLQIEHIDVGYRQSRKLAEFARKLGGIYGYDINERAPEDMNNLGFEPVLGHSLGSMPERARWLADRIREINSLTEGALPTIAILACDAETLDPLAEFLSAELEDMNIRAVACPKGLIKGQEGDVRIFEVEHIKGLEFEAVFFLDMLQDLGGRLDVLINNAGIEQRAVTGTDSYGADWRRLMAVNLDSAAFLTQAALPLLEATKGCVINIASIQAYAVLHTANTAYTVSKAAIAQLTKAMAVEYAPKGVRVNAIAPGVVETPMIRQAGMDPARFQLFLDRIPMQRFAKPEEIVGPAQFLASSAAAYVTGVILPVDGGFLAM